jgi:hypothetical protein
MVLSPTVKSYKHMPVVHLLYKALPQRCQFRNFSNVTIDYLQKHPGCVEWMRSIFVWSVYGSCYPWAVRCSSARTVPSESIDWNAFFKDNVRLFFFVVKEFFVFLVLQQPGLTIALDSVHSWKLYEAEIVRTMNNVRDIVHSARYSREKTPPWRDVAVVINKFIPRQLKCIKPVTDNHFERILCSVWDKYSIDEVQSVTKTIPFPSTLKGWKQLQNQYYKEVVALPEWWCLMQTYSKHVCETLDNFDEHARHVVLRCLICFRTCQAIQWTPLPKSQVQKQIVAVRKRFDMGTGSSVKEIQRISRFFFCISCENFRGFTSSRNNHTQHAYGHRALSYNFSTGQVYCSASASRKKRRIFKCHDTPCVSLSLLGRATRVFGTTWVLCTCCGVVCQLGVKPGYTGDIMCGTCSASNETRSESTVCSFCGRCGRVSPWQCYNDMTKPHRVQRVYLCAQHTDARWNSGKFLLKSEIWGSGGNLRES